MSSTPAGTPHGQIADADAATARTRRQEERQHWTAAHPGESLPRPVASDGPTLSVVVTAHNVGPWIGELLESLRHQTLTDVEYLLVDDHSTDETAAAVDTIAAEDPRFRVIRPVERGGAHARNVGADHARGRFIAFCDGDDIVPKHAYAALVDAADGQDIVFGDFLKFFPERTWHPTRDVMAEARSDLTLADHPDLLNYRAVWNKVFRTEFWRTHDIVFPEVVRSNDIVPMVTAYLAADRMAIVPRFTYLYRDRPGATSMTSGVGSQNSLLSYLRQETACSELVTGHPARTVFESLFAARDGWVQTSRYLLELAGGPVDRDVAAGVRRLWDLIGPDVRDALPYEQRITFAALVGPDPDQAAATVFALDATLARTDPVRWLATSRRLLDEQHELLTSVADLNEVVTGSLTAGVRKLLRSRAVDPETIGTDTVLLDHLRALLDAIDRACGGTPTSILNLNVRLHGGLDALRNGDDAGFGRRLARFRESAMVLTSVTRVRGGLLLAGDLTSVDGLTPLHLAKRVRSGHRQIAPVTIDPTDPTRWTALIGRQRLQPNRRHRINVIGRIGDEEEMFHLTHTEGLGTHEARLPTTTVHVSAPEDRWVVHVRWTLRAARARRLVGRLRRLLRRR